jgi:hypothetical protein
MKISLINEGLTTPDPPSPWTSTATLIFSMRADAAEKIDWLVVPEELHQISPAISPGFMYSFLPSRVQKSQP